MAARLIVLGRQGAGKGTQCARLAARLGISHVSTGDLFRAEIGSGSKLGRELASYVNEGELVPDDVVLDVVARKLGSSSTRAGGYLLDGFPRTLAQGQALFEVLGGGAADLALEIDVPVDVVVRRLACRRICVDCHAITAVDGDDDDDDRASHQRCPDCDGPLERRDDDRPDAIARRLSLYDEQAGPLLVWFDAQGILESINGNGDPDDVHERIVATVARRVPMVRSRVG